MGQHIGSSHCTQCNRQVATTSYRQPAILHLLAVIAGFFVYWPFALVWLIIWILAEAFTDGRARCNVCGGDVRKLARAARKEDARLKQKALWAARARRSPNLLMTFMPTIITSGLIIIAVVGVVAAYTVYDRHQQGVAQEMHGMTIGGFNSVEDFRRARFMGITTAKALRDYEERQASIPKRTP